MVFAFPAVPLVILIQELRLIEVLYALIKGNLSFALLTTLLEPTEFFIFFIFGLFLLFVSIIVHSWLLLRWRPVFATIHRGDLTRWDLLSPSDHQLDILEIMSRIKIVIIVQTSLREDAIVSKVISVGHRAASAAEAVVTEETILVVSGNVFEGQGVVEGALQGVLLEVFPVAVVKVGVNNFKLFLLGFGDKIFPCQLFSTLFVLLKAELSPAFPLLDLIVHVFEGSPEEPEHSMMDLPQGPGLPKPKDPRHWEGVKRGIVAVHGIV
jgi:hypothetical protein